MKPMIEVECIDGVIPEGLSLSTEPLILRQLVSHWPLVEAGLSGADEAIAYLLKYYSGKPLTAFLSAPENAGRLFYNEAMTGFNFQPIRGVLNEILSELRQHQQQSSQPPTCYVGSTHLNTWFPKFEQHNLLQLNVESPLVSIWLGNQTRVAAHYDFPSNIACNAVGHRRFTLFPPEQLENLYVGPLDFTPAGQAVSLVDITNPDFERFPKFRQAIKHSQLGELQPGDAIYIPSMWWHQVESLDDFNVLINYWWRSTPEYCGSPFNTLQHAILAWKDMPKEQRKVWKDLLNYYVFDTENSDFTHIPEHRGELHRAITPEVANRLIKNIKQ